MITATDEQLAKMKSDYPGITQAIQNLEEASFPQCPACKSQDNALVGIGMVGHSINIAGATTRFQLLANGQKPGRFCCTSCESYFDR